MLAALGFATVLIVLAVIVADVMSPLIALIVVPCVAALVGGFGLGAGGDIVSGITTIAPVAGMYVFAILFFGVMTDAGLLDPIVGRILHAVGNRPSHIVVATALLALLIHLEGSGAVCFLIAIPAMRPAFDRLGMDRRILACAASLAAGVNFLPWMGVVLQASISTGIPVQEIFRPLIGVQAIGFVYVFAVCWWMGKREERRLKLVVNGGTRPAELPTTVSTDPALRRPRLFWPNLVLTLIVMAVIVGGWLNAVVVFMIGLAIALTMNYPRVKEQRARIDAHAPEALFMASVLLAAGAFSGIMTDTGMLKAMASTTVSHIPPSAGPHIPFILALVSMPLSLIFDPVSFHMGMLPVIAKVYEALGGRPVEVVQAALLGQMTTGFPISPLTPATFLLVRLCGLDLATHQRFSIPYLFMATIVMTIAAVAMGVFAL